MIFLLTSLPLWARYVFVLIFWLDTSLPPLIHFLISGAYKSVFWVSKNPHRLPLFPIHRSIYLVISVVIE